ncbi:MAG: PKD domain-containing protein [Ignavibacteria bacterium]|nr:PKD domain-containing protein [Ignavibacteria bacterium]
MTRHFATSTVTSFGKTSEVSDLSSLAGIFVISVKESHLNGQAVINTGFKPKIDDWEFVNEGSYIEPEGHCAGQAMTMMWYYYQQKLRGKPQLFHLLDMSKSDDLFWQDNPTGFRFASVIQQDIDFNSLSRTLIRNLLDRGADALFWNAFIASMILTGEPQYVALRRYNANRQFLYGHAIVAHKINVSEGKIFVTDPNYPGTERVITYSNGSFTPYNTKQNTTQADPEPYQGIGCFHKSSMIDWSTISARWKQVQDSSIGTVAPNVFPSYIIRTTDSRQATITESVIAVADTIGIEVECPTCQIWYTGSDHLTTFKIRLGESRLAASDVNGKFLLDDLRPGENTFTIEIDNWSPDGTYKTYLDFRRLTIWYYSLRILAARADSVPMKKPGDKNTDYAFVASMPGGGPKKFRVDWSFGDGSPREVRTNDSTVTHKWQADGEYLVTARLYDDASGRFITSVSVTAKIGVFEMLSVEPAKDTVGAIVRIAGRGFGPVKGTFERVWFTDAAGPQWQVTATIRAWGDSLIEATVPKQAGTGWVHVDIRGSKQDSLAFTVIPKVTEMSPPRSWLNGPMVIVYGAGFGAAQGTSRLTIAGRPVDSILQWTDTRIDFKVSEGLCSGPLVVTVGANASTPAHMTIGTMAWLKNTSTMQANFSAMMTKKKSPDNTTLDGIELWELDTAPLSGSIAWNGLSFSLSSTSSTGTNQTTIVEFNGTVDSTGQLLKTAYIKKTVTDGAPPTRQTVFEYTVTDLPVRQANQTAGTVGFSLSGAALQAHMSGIAYTFTSSIPPAYGWTYVSTDWASTAPKPSLWVTFKK